MTVAAQLDQLCIKPCAHFPSMPCSRRSPGIPVRPEYGNEQTRRCAAGILFNMHTAKDVPVDVCCASNIRATT
ncbi:MAG: hypothetical protein WB870_16070 [Gallionellaceae bacterium]